MIPSVTHWQDTVESLARRFAERAAGYDASDSFVAENYADLREVRLFSAMAPRELGGGGLSYGGMCALVRILGRGCGPSALAFSMHQHLVATAVWNYRHGRPGEAMLRAVAQDDKILVSTGANDWLASSGNLERCEGGYRFTARKRFASGCMAGDLMVTSGQYDDPAAGRQVLHFFVPMSAPGVAIERDWEAMGMRGSGSHTVAVEDVFVANEAISLRRPCGEYHPIWNVILTFSLPLICSAYVGVAEAAAEKGVMAARRRRDALTAVVVGEMQNELTTAQIGLESMIANTGGFDADVTIERANGALIRKTIVAEAVRLTSEKALEASGGSGYLRSSGIERLLRDIEAAQFHPMPAKEQQLFTGRLAMGLDPVSEE